MWLLIKRSMFVRLVKKCLQCYRTQRDTHCGPRVDSASNRNEYQEYFMGGKGGRCVGLENLPPSCADCLEIWGSVQGCTGSVLPLSYRNQKIVNVLTKAGTKNICYCKVMCYLGQDHFLSDFFHILLLISHPTNRQI